MNTSFVDICKSIEQEKSTFKIVTKTKNENFFIERWILHYLNIVQDARLIIFDNMSDDDYVHSIYRKYKDNILLVSFDMYMDTIHDYKKSILLYKSLSVSSNFFTIIDSGEYLYLYDRYKVVNDNSIVKFLENNSDCNFFVPCWMENIKNNDKAFYFNPRNLSLFHLSKPIVNSKLIDTFDAVLSKGKTPIIHHTQQLPISAYGKAPTRFLLLHLKNLNGYQRIRTNMEKLVALNILKNTTDYAALINLDPNAVTGYGYNYVVQTKKIIEDIQCAKEDSGATPHYRSVEIHEDGTLKFIPDVYEKDLRELMNSDYFDLIRFDPNKTDLDSGASIFSHLAQGKSHQV